MNSPKNCSKNHLKDAMPKWQPFSQNSQMHQILTNLLMTTDIPNNDVVKTAVAVQRGKPWEISNLLSEQFINNGLFDPTETSKAGITSRESKPKI